MKHIKQNLHLYMIATIFAAFANIQLTGGFVTPRPLMVAYVVLFVIFPVLINSKIIDVLKHFKEPRPLFCSLAINFLVSPAIAYMLAKLFLSSRPELFAVLVLLSLVPTSAMSVAWTSFSRGSTETALYLIPVNILFAAVIALPFLFPLLIGSAMQIKTGTIIINLLIVFFAPLILGDITRKVIIKVKGGGFFEKRVKPALGSVSAIGILGLIFLAMSMPRNKMLFDNWSLLLFTLTPVLLYYASLYLITSLWAIWLIKSGSVAGDKAVVLVYTSVARHINICLALLMSTFTLEQVAPMLLCLILAYIVQVLSLALYAQKVGLKIVGAIANAV